MTETMMNLITTSCLLLLLLFIKPSSGNNIYKCVSADGSVKYSDEPCSDAATVAFESVNRPFDEVIGNASPYTSQPVQTYDMDDEMLHRHAKKIAQTIIPSENISSFKRIRSPLTPGWNFFLQFGKEKDQKKIVVSLEYRVNQTPEGAYIWLNRLRVSQNSKPYDPPTMTHVQTFEKTGTGEWVIQIKRIKMKP